MRIRDRVSTDPLGFVVGAVLVFVHVWWGVELTAHVEGAADWLHQWLIRPDDARGLIHFGALSKTEFLIDHQYWRAFTSFAVHGSLLHLALNLSALLALSPLAVRLYGARETLLGVAGSTLVGSVSSGLWGEGAVSVGASGGIFGLAAAIWLELGHVRGGTQNLESAEVIDRSRLGWALVLSLGLGWVVTWLDLGFRVDQVGHLGGLGFGLCWGSLRRLPHWRWHSAALLVLVGLALSRFVLLPRFADVASNSVHLEVALNQVERGEAEEGLARLRSIPASELTAVQLNDAGYRLAIVGSGLDLAEALVRSALVLQPAEPNFLDSIGWIECLTGRTAAGLEHLQAAAAGFGSVPDEVADHIRNCSAAAKLDG